MVGMLSKQERGAGGGWREERVEPNAGIEKWYRISLGMLESVPQGS